MEIRFENIVYHIHDVVVVIPLHSHRTNPRVKDLVITLTTGFLKMKWVSCSVFTCIPESVLLLTELTGHTKCMHVSVHQ